MTSLLALASPFILNAIVGLFKMGADKLSTTSKRVILAAFALIGAIAYSSLTGTPVNMDSLSSLWGIITDAAVAFLMSHGTYTLFFNSASK